MTNVDQAFVVHELKRPSPQYFGRIILITAIGDDRARAADGRQHIFSESYVLLEHHDPRLVRRSLSARPQDYAEFGVAINAKFMMDAAYEVCTSCVAEVVQEEFKLTGDWKLFSTPLAYERVDSVRLGLFWGLNLWHSEMKLIAAKTECHELAKLLSVVFLLDVTVAKPLHE
jgi:hypothetical protein